MKKPQKDIEYRGTVLILSSIYWGFTWQCYQQITTGFAKRGYYVYFVHPLGSRWKSKSHGFVRRVINRISNPSKNLPFHMDHPVPAGVEFARPGGVPDKYWPAQLFNRRVAVPNFVKELKQRGLPRPLIYYNYLPLPYTLALQKELQPDIAIYDAVYDFERVPGSEAGAWDEAGIVAASDLVFANSPYHRSRMQELGASVIEFLPAVDTDLFEQARSEPGTNHETPICAYFGTISAVNQDLDLLREVSHHYPLRMIGPSDNEYEGFDPQTEWCGPIAFTDLPKTLKDVDILLLPYYPHKHVEAVTPAKTFECLATGKPTVVIGLSSLDRFHDYFYLCNTHDEFFAAIDLASRENPALIEQRINLARKNSLDQRIDQIIEIINQTISIKNIQPATITL